MCASWYIWIAPVLFLNDLKIINNGNNNNHNNNVNHACMKRTLKPPIHWRWLANNDRCMTKRKQVAWQFIISYIRFVWSSRCFTSRAHICFTYRVYFFGPLPHSRSHSLRAFQLIHQKLLILIHRTGFFPSTFRAFFMIMRVLYFVWLSFFSLSSYFSVWTTNDFNRVRKTCFGVWENLVFLVHLLSKNWFVLTPMLENLLIFQVTSEIMTGIRLFPNWRPLRLRGYQVRTKHMATEKNNNNEVKKKKRKE